MSNPYVAAGYLIIWVSIFLYAWSLNRRLTAARRTLGSLLEDVGDTGTPRT